AKVWRGQQPTPWRMPSGAGRDGGWCWGPEKAPRGPKTAENRLGRGKNRCPEPENDAPFLTEGAGFQAHRPWCRGAGMRGSRELAGAQPEVAHSDVVAGFGHGLTGLPGVRDARRVRLLHARGGRQPDPP